MARDDLASPAEASDRGVTAAEAFVERIGWRAAPRRGPLYSELCSVIREAVQTGLIRARDALPPERDLSRVLGISRTTLRHAFDDLTLEGLIERRRGSGAVVLEQPPYPITDGAPWGRLATEYAISWADCSTGQITADEAMEMGLPLATTMLRLDGSRSVAGVTIALTRTAVPAAILREFPKPGQGLREVFGQNRPVRTLARRRAVTLHAAQAESLGFAQGTPGIEVLTKGFAANGSAVELTRSWFGPDGDGEVTERWLRAGGQNERGGPPEFNDPA